LLALLIKLTRETPNRVKLQTALEKEKKGLLMNLEKKEKKPLLRFRPEGLNPIQDKIITALTNTCSQEHS
jgi:hypothetical protein